MKRFPQDTSDPIEQVYSGEISQLFPNYGTFWQKFIGVKTHPNFPGRIFPYGLQFPAAFGAQERTRIERAYEETTMAHYTLFCHLAGAHFQIKQLERALGLTNPQTKQIEHWEAFEVTYLHLGITFNEAHHLWNLMATMKGTSSSSGAQLLRELLVTANNPDILRDFEQLETDIKDRRNNVTHYARGASRIYDGRIYIPLRQQRNVPWTTELESREWIETLPKAKADLKNVEKIINAVHEHLIDQFESYYSANNILVDYSCTT